MKLNIKRLFHSFLFFIRYYMNSPRYCKFEDLIKMSHRLYQGKNMFANYIIKDRGVQIYQNLENIFTPKL